VGTQLPSSSHRTFCRAAVLGPALQYQMPEKFKGDIWEDSRKEYVLSLLRQQSRLAWCTVGIFFLQGPACKKWSHGTLKWRINLFLLLVAWNAPVERGGVLWPAHCWPRQRTSWGRTAVSRTVRVTDRQPCLTWWNLLSKDEVAEVCVLLGFYAT
jgi:hypothetical protein